ncbi:hypothetical protein BGW36DRAFT_379638 [Talaromyces proteolyticus]|uniref:Uncharacterized protein n=1 Tax=Talaromyces proteolyticus TaxID=1131652 RepID=A0AAD4KS31_9EURO|nr:uncharacterized protein BGW36DRAFT_379638 [Talaromyces proteolyticus]KAH8697901.1 hypothetical protein BGW36DRAFT_379638 [Talaromyces proteolyticus]
MTSLLSNIGLGIPGINNTSIFLIANWLYAYGILSTRVVKQQAGIDDNRNPRLAFAKYGERAVSEGKITRRQFERIQRLQSAHENAVEGYTFFVAAILFANIAKVDTATINLIGVWYSLSRIAYGLAYYYIEDKSLSYVRSACWWSGNWSCIMGIWWAGRNLA